MVVTFVVLSILHIIVNIVGVIVFLEDLYGGCGYQAERFLEDMQEEGFIKAFCEGGEFKIKHIFLIWLFIYAIILLVLGMNLKKVGDITLFKKK